MALIFELNFCLGSLVRGLKKFASNPHLLRHVSNEKMVIGEESEFIDREHVKSFMMVVSHM